MLETGDWIQSLVCWWQPYPEKSTQIQLQETWPDLQNLSVLSWNGQWKRQKNAIIFLVDLAKNNFYPYIYPFWIYVRVLPWPKTNYPYILTLPLDYVVPSFRALEASLSVTKSISISISPPGGLQGYKSREQNPCLTKLWISASDPTRFSPTPEDQINCPSTGSH